MPKKKPKKGKPEVHEELEGFDIKINEFGEIISNFSVDKINEFLDENVDDKKLLGDYITEEEMWACNSCNACTQACPVNNDPLKVIIDVRQFLVMEQSKIPSELASAFTNIENNGAPWQF